MLTVPYVAVFVGGGLGAVARFALSSAIGQKMGIGFPWGTLAVNLLGALLIGLITETLALKLEAPAALRSFLVTGFLGGFTTFSAFSLESALLLARGDYGALAAYIAVSVLGTLFLVLLATHALRAVL